MHQELQLCVQHWTIEKDQLFSITERLDYETLPYSAYSPDLLKYLDNFLQEKLFNNQVAAQNAFEKFIKNSVGKGMWILMAYVSINKVYLQLIYIDLKSMVKNMYRKMMFCTSELTC